MWFRPPSLVAIHRASEPSPAPGPDLAPRAFRADRAREGLPATAAPRATRAFARRPPDHTQRLRQAFQVAFLLLNAWIGVQFYLFVRYYETAGQSVRVARPAGVEGWLPIAALMNVKYTLLTGSLLEVHTAGLFLLVAFVSMAWLLRKSFCSWLCPIGTLSERLWQGGEALFGRTLPVPRWLDVPLRSLKYALLGLFVYAVASMSVEGIRTFLESPYGLVADVKMLNFFRFLGTTGAIVIGALLLVSVPIKNAWCRYLCPYGALLGLVALVSPVRIRRDAEACIDCGKCARACPSALPVDVLASVRSAECTACMLCVTACPASGALDLTARRRPVTGWALAVAIAALFIGLTGYARLTGHWDTHLPDAVYFDLIPRANAFAHP
jgi:polyferredoxin